MPGDSEVTAGNVKGALIGSMLDFVAKQSPAEQEKLGDRELDEARGLIEELNSEGDLRLVEGKITYARDMKLVMDSKRGLSKYLLAREYRKCATSAHRVAKTLSERVKDAAAFAAQRPDPPPANEMPARDPVIDVAFSHLRIYLICKDAFPTHQLREEWAEAVWREACAKTGTYPDPYIPYELCERNMKLFIETKNKIMHVVETLYGFDTSHAPDSIRNNAALAQALLTDMAFIYREPDFGGISHHPYRHPALQRVINITWFQNKDDAGVVFHKHFSPLSVPAVAFILAVMECCIDEWTDGTRKDTEWDDTRFKTVYQSHISSVNDFWRHDVAQKGDVFEHIRSCLLKEARIHAGAPQDPVTEIGRFTPDALGAVHREDSLPAYPDQDLQVPEINITSDEA